MPNRFNGTVIWYDMENGYGIIRIGSSTKTVSINAHQVHHDSSSTVRPLRVGQTVSFEVDNVEAKNLYIN